MNESKSYLKLVLPAALHLFVYLFVFFNLTSTFSYSVQLLFTVQ